MRASRESWYPLDDIREDLKEKAVLFRSPVYEQLRNMTKGKSGMADTISPFIVGWKGFSESDFIPSGSSDLLETFDREVFEEWLMDNPDVAVKIGDRLIEVANARFEKEKERKGNSNSA